MEFKQELEKYRKRTTTTKNTNKNIENIFINRWKYNYDENFAFYLVGWWR